MNVPKVLYVSIQFWNHICTVTTNVFQLIPDSNKWQPLSSIENIHLNHVPSTLE